MTIFINTNVQNFIYKIMLLDYEKYQIVEEVRKIVSKHFPNVKERKMYGGIIFSEIDDFAGIFVYKNHISVEFSYGYKFIDPENLLEGRGKYRRHLKIKSMECKGLKKLDFFLKQIHADHS